MDDNGRTIVLEVENFLKRWTDYIESDHPRDTTEIIKALSFLGTSPRSDSRSFIVASLSHPDASVRLTALYTMGSLINMGERYEDSVYLYDALENETNEVVLGSALAALGHVGHHHDTQKIMSVLLTWVLDQGRGEHARRGAYKGIIYCMCREGHPDFHTFDIDPNAPIEDQIDWQWIDELVDQFGAQAD